MQFYHFLFLTKALIRKLSVPSLRASEPSVNMKLIKSLPQFFQLFIAFLGRNSKTETIFVSQNCSLIFSLLFCMQRLLFTRRFVSGYSVLCLKYKEVCHLNKFVTDSVIYYLNSYNFTLFLPRLMSIVRLS